MKKVILGTLLFLLLASTAYAGVVTVDAFLSADSVTIAHLEQFRTRVVDGINNPDGGNLQNNSVTHSKLDANSDPVNRWSESFNDYAYTGLLPTTTSGTLTSVTSAGTAYVQGYRVVKDATSHLYTATKDTYIDLNYNGTYTYSEVGVGASAPTVATNSIRLAKVTTNGSEITAVTDLRVTSIQIGSTNEDFYIAGFGVSDDAVTTISVAPGAAKIGTTFVGKIANTPLDITSASDYLSGSSERGASKRLYIYTGIAGTLKLDDNPPDYHDTSGNSVGALYYYKYGSTYYRNLGSVYLNGSQNVTKGTGTAIGLGNVVQTVYYQTGVYNSGSTAMTQNSSIPQNTAGDEYMTLAITPTSTTNKLKIDVVVFGGCTTGSNGWSVALFQDSTANALAAGMAPAISGDYDRGEVTFTYYKIAGTTSTTTFKVRAGVHSSGTFNFNGTGGNQTFGGVMASSITVTEIT